MGAEVVGPEVGSLVGDFVGSAGAPNAIAIEVVAPASVELEGVAAGAGV